MPKLSSSGRVKTSLTVPDISTNTGTNTSEVKYYGLVRDEALSDIESPSAALAEVLRDIQDPAEALVEGTFIQQDLEITDGITKYNLKNEDFAVLTSASINFQDDEGTTLPLVNPRQRISDRIKQLETFAGRGTIYQGQGTVMYKYQVRDSEDAEVTYDHFTPPPFYTENLDSNIENAPDFIPSSNTEIANTHRVGYLENGIFVPDKETEYWWSGEYDHGMRGRSEYGGIERTSENDPKYPIVRDGNLSFSLKRPSGVSNVYNWGLRFDTWFRKDRADKDYGRFVVQVNGHLRIDVFERTGYNPSTGAIQGNWVKLIDTTNPGTYYVQDTIEITSVSSPYGYRRHFVQGGPSVPVGSGAVNTPRNGTEGGVLDYSKTFEDLEGKTISAFDGGYVPMVIRYWYGKPIELDPDDLPSPSERPGLTPGLVPSFCLDHYMSIGYTKWDDYSSRVKLQWDGDKWVVVEGGDDADLSRYNPVFQVYAHKLQEASPDGAGVFAHENWDVSTSLVTGIKDEVDPQTAITGIQIPGFVPELNEFMWVVLRNRPINAIPSEYEVTGDELWQGYLYNPDIIGSYESVDDMLEGVGINYVEPDPSKVSFDINYDYYKSKFGQLPELNTYGPDRYDGSLPVTLTSSAGQRDYDYKHGKLLMVGRQKKGTIGEIGDVPPVVGKDLADGEERNDGENYTFINVVSDERGNGGNIIINAYPANNIGILNAGDTGEAGKALTLDDNTRTYNNPSRQNIQSLTAEQFPSNTNFDNNSAVAMYHTGNLLYRVDPVSGTYDVNSTGFGGTLAFSPVGNVVNGTPTRSHAVNSGFITKFRVYDGVNNDEELAFYGLVGFVRPSAENVTLVVETGGTTIINPTVFPNLIGENSYQGTILEFKDSNGDPIPVEVSYTGETITVSAFHNGYPVKGYLYYPTSSNVGSSPDLVILLHPSVDTEGVSPSEAALNFLDIAKTQIKIQDKIILSIAYPQDDIPLWNINPELAQEEFPGLNYSTLLFGDNYAYVEAAFLWAENNLNNYLAERDIPKTFDRMFVFGHSQGGYLAHKLSTLYSLSGGVISNAPGPIDLLTTCEGSELNGDINPVCVKIKNALGSTTANPNAYDSRSSKGLLSQCPLSRILFSQAYDDTIQVQVPNMQNILQPALVGCELVTIKYYDGGGHAAFVTNQILQLDIRDFLESIAPGEIDSDTITGAYVTGYDPTSERVTFAFSTGSVTAGTYSVDVWYNYLKMTAAPTKVVTANGNPRSSDFVWANNTTKVQINYTFNSGYQFSRADNGAGLSFSETLFFAENTTPTSVNPFLSGTEAPAPPTEIVTPFGYDNSSMNLADPGLGGITYPPYTTQSLNLEGTVRSTSALEEEPTGEFDMWFGSTSNQSNLGEKFLKITKKLMFDFSKAERTNLLSALTNAQKPDFITASPTPYSHKLYIELNADIPEGTTNDSLYLDAKTHSNNKPVKELYFLFINKNGSDLEVLAAENPNF